MRSDCCECTSQDTKQVVNLTSGRSKRENDMNNKQANKDM